MLLAALFLFLGNPKTIILIIFILVIFFGAKRIPELFKGVGQGVREFKDASRPEQPVAPNYPQPNTNYTSQQPGYNQGGYAPQQPNTNYNNPNYNPQAPNQLPTSPYNNPNNQPAS